MPDIEMIDAHQHFWDVEDNYIPWLCDEPPISFRYGDYRRLRRNYLVSDYLADTSDFNVVGTVFVETEWDRTRPTEETQWVDKLRRRTGLPTVMVAHAKLDDRDVEHVLARHASFDFVRGIRHKPVSPPEAGRPLTDRTGSMLDGAWRSGFALLSKYNMSFDLQTPWWNLGDAANLARAFPDTPIIINHTGLPADRSPQALEGWRGAMRQVAECENVSVKISGICLPGEPWTADLNREVVLRTIDLFGTERCMFASNFPVDGLIADFGTILNGFLEITLGFSKPDRDHLFRSNAMRVYRIPHDALATRRRVLN